MTKLHFVVPLLFFCNLSFGVELDFEGIDVRVSQCAKDAVKVAVNSWVSDPSKMPATKGKGTYKPLYQALQKCGVFSQDSNPNDREIDLMFGRSAYFDRGTGHVSIQTSEGRRYIYELSKTNNQFEVSEIVQESNTRGFVRLLGDNMTDLEKKNVLETFISDCRMANPIVLDVIESHAARWISSKQIPDWKNKHKGYEDLFEDLMSKGVFDRTTDFEHHIFGRSYDFTSNRYGSPHLGISVGNMRYEYKIDPDSKKLIRPPACDSAKLVKLNQQMVKLSKLSEDTTSDAESAPSGR